MTPKQLLRSTPSEVKQRARGVRITDAKRSVIKSTKRMRVVATVSSRSRPGLKHKVVVEATSSKATGLHDTNVRVWCNCEFFTFYGCSDVLPLYNAGFKARATGIMPDVRNPSRVPFVCMHCVRVLNKILRDKK